MKSERERRKYIKEVVELCEKRRKERERERREDKEEVELEVSTQKWAKKY